MKKFILFFSDLAVFYLSLVLTLVLRYGKVTDYIWNLHFLPFTILFLVWLIVYYITDLYEVTNLKNNAFFYESLLRATIIASAIAVIFFYLIPIFSITPKTNLVIFIIVYTVLEGLNRAFSNSVLSTRFRRPLIIIGLNSQSVELARFIKAHPQLGYELQYVVSLHDPSIINLPEKPDHEGLPIIHGIHNLEQIIDRGAVAGIVISPEAYQINDITNLLYRSLDRNIVFYNLSFFYERVTGRVPLGAINQIWFLENLSERKKKTYEFFKRSGDIVLALVGGLISLVFYPFIIMAIKYTSPGPVFYNQKRVGYLGRQFTMTKFRTMKHGAEKKTGPVWASADDPRVTMVGGFLRRTRLDELPQLWMILKGEMSFVGPRAERPEFQKTLQINVPFYEERYLIKPGLTGWAQINYHYGSSVKDAAEKLQYDLYYIKNRSIILDIGIILKTIRIALQQSGQ